MQHPPGQGGKSLGFIFFFFFFSHKENLFGAAFGFGTAVKHRDPALCSVSLSTVHTRRWSDPGRCHPSLHMSWEGGRLPPNPPILCPFPLLLATVQCGQQPSLPQVSPGPKWLGVRLALLGEGEQDPIQLRALHLWGSSSSPEHGGSPRCTLAFPSISCPGSTEPPPWHRVGVCREDPGSAASQGWPGFTRFLCRRGLVIASSC